MNVNQFHREFKIAFDKTDSKAYPEFLDGEIDYYLNEAQERFVKQRYNLNNIYRTGFETTQKRTDDLKNLVISRYTDLTVVPYELPRSTVYKASLSSLFQDKEKTLATNEAYMFFIKAMAQTCIGNCCEWSMVRLVQQDDLTTVINDPFNSPRLDKPIIFFEEGNIFIWTLAGATVEGFLLTFIKSPSQINIGTYGGTLTECELSEHTHKEILNMAVSIALENIESPRQQSQEILNVQRVE